MKKVRVLALSHRKKEVTAALGTLGTLHIETRTAQSQDLEALREKHQRWQRAYLTIPEDKNASVPSDPYADLDSVEEIAEKVLETADEMKGFEDEAGRLQKEIDRIEPWGDFDPLLFDQDLGDSTYLFPAQLNKDHFRKIPVDLRYILLPSEKDIKRVMFLDNPEEAEGDFQYEALRLPEDSLSKLMKRRDEALAGAERMRTSIQSFQTERKQLEKGLKLLEAEQEFAAVEASLEDYEELQLITEIEGFIPEKQTGELKSFASKEGLGLVIQDPASDDNVPTLTDNPRAVGIIKPIFNFMGTTPGYKELDISFWFLLFFTIFVAMIIGDAGYGAILAVAAVFLSISSKAKTGKVPDGLILFNVLSFATVAWGAVTGNWFGYGPIADLPVLNQLVIPALDSFDVENSQAVTQMIQLICFVIALVHLLLAHLLAFSKKIQERPRIHAIADLGWLTAIIGLFFLVLNVVISVERYPVPDWSMYLIGGGIGAVFIFSAQEGDGFFKGIARGLGNFINIALDGVSAFADIISYIRLFAVGLASIEIARSFNDMAEGMMESGIGGIIGGIVVLALGHTLNLVMGALSVIVHGIRLKMLEFSSHVGNEWAGFEYKPFKN